MVSNGNSLELLDHTSVGTVASIVNRLVCFDEQYIIYIHIYFCGNKCTYMVLDCIVKDYGGMLVSICAGSRPLGTK